MMSGTREKTWPCKQFVRCGSPLSPGRPSSRTAGSLVQCPWLPMICWLDTVVGLKREREREGEDVAGVEGKRLTGSPSHTRTPSSGCSTQPGQTRVYFAHPWVPGLGRSWELNLGSSHLECRFRPPRPSKARAHAPLPRWWLAWHAVLNPPIHPAAADSRPWLGAPSPSKRWWSRDVLVRSPWSFSPFSSPPCSVSFSHYPLQFAVRSGSRALSVSATCQNNVRYGKKINPESESTAVTACRGGLDFLRRGVTAPSQPVWGSSAARPQRGPGIGVWRGLAAGPPAPSHRPILLLFKLDPLTVCGPH